VVPRGPRHPHLQVSKRNSVQHVSFHLHLSYTAWFINKYRAMTCVRLEV
jgi:hypothetical protein